MKGKLRVFAFQLITEIQEEQEKNRLALIFLGRTMNSIRRSL